MTFAMVTQRCLRNLGDGAEKPTYIFTEPCLGYRMEGEETQVSEEGGKGHQAAGYHKIREASRHGKGRRKLDKHLTRE